MVVVRGPQGEEGSMARWTAHAAQALPWPLGERARRRAIRDRLARLPAGGYPGSATGEECADGVKGQGRDAAPVAARRRRGGEQGRDDRLLGGLDGGGEVGVEVAAADRAAGGRGGPVPPQAGREREEDLPGPVVADGAGPGES